MRLKAVVELKMEAGVVPRIPPQKEETPEPTARRPVGSGVSFF